MKILITGNAGAIGSHLGEAFASSGNEVVGIDNLNPYYDPRIKQLNLIDLKSKGATILVENINTYDLSTIGDDVEAIFHFAAQPGISQATSFVEYVNNNIYATNALLQYARTLPKLKAFVHISTSSVYGASARGGEDVVPEPISPYGITKLAAEQLALSAFRSEGLPVVALRLFSVYGPRERPEKLYHKLINAVLNDTEFPLHEGSENHVRSFTYVSDIVDACMKALNAIDNAKGQIINIGSRETHTTGEGIDLVAEIAGVKPKLVRTPPRYGDQRETEAIIDKAEELLGFVPKVGLREGLLRQFIWQKDHLLPFLNAQGEV